MPYITLVVPTITQYERLHKMLLTVSESTRIPDRIVVIDNGRVPPAMIDEFAGLYTDWEVQPKNLGVAGSCNLALRTAVQQPNGLWLHANDDIEISKSVIRDLEKAYEAQPDQLMFNPICAAGSAFTFFLMPARKAIDDIGWWDEKFFPAYFEDNDYAYRMSLNGYRHIDVEGGTYVHHVSSTKNAYTGHEVEQGHATFRANQARYIRKWGGLPGDEQYTVPFKGAAE